MDRSIQRSRLILGHLESNDTSSSISAQGTVSLLDSQPTDLDAERRNVSFKIRQLTYLLDGGEQFTKVTEDINRQIERDPILNDGLMRYDLDRAEARWKCTEKMIRVWEILKKTRHDPIVRNLDFNVPDFQSLFIQQIDRFDRSLGMRWFVHWGLFINTILTHGTPEQIEKWVDDAENLRVIGCFGMTELGHSSHLRGLETTATYDKKLNEFVIVSPTVTSTKWWIGVSGQIATHCTVFARLIVDEKDYGVHIFVVPLRNKASGNPVAGVSVGDLGPKFGRNGLDNGWIQFSGVHIPLENMLMKWSQLSADGTYTPSVSPQLPYVSVIGERCLSLKATNDLCNQALTIAIRYGIIRRQGEGDPQIFDFQIQQYSLIPHIAISYATHFTFKRLIEKFYRVNDNMRQGDIASLIKVLPDIHNTSACLKATVTWWGTEALESSRRALGGHGYSSYSAIPSLIGDFGVMTTGGGDNYVLAQQTARYLMKTYQNVMANKKPAAADLSISYLFDMKEIIKNGALKVSKMEDLFDPHLILNALRYAAIKIISQTATHLRNDTAAGKTSSECWNTHMVDLIQCSRAHSFVYLLDSFIGGMKPIRNLPSGDGLPIIEVLTKLATLSALRMMETDSSLFIETGCILADHIPIIRKAVIHLCKDLRKDAIGLVDAFNFPDFIINSPLGRKDGNIYEHYLHAVQNSRGNGKAPYWDTLIKPLTTATKSENRK